MALKEIAVEGLTIEPQGIVSGGILSIVSTPSINSKIDGKGIYSGSLQFTVTGANATGYDPKTVMTVGTASILPTAIYTKIDGQLVLRVDDENLSVSMTGTISGTPTPFVEPFKITNAGQIKVKAE